MTLPRFLLEPGELDTARPGSRLTLGGAEGRHAAAVRRITAGESLHLTDGAGMLATCSVAAAGRDRLELLVEAVEDVPPPALRFTLAQALAKGGRDELAVESATELGVDEVLPWQASRSVVIWSGERGERSRQRWVATARAAAKQSRRVRVPGVGELLGTAALAGRLAAADLALVLHEDAARPLAEVELPEAGEVLLVVGPEGGIEPAELERFSAAGAGAVRLGPEVLRSSTAGAAAIAVLSVRAGRW
jgi:16S rRNA (uracil1498-N3)-methyltransferase